VENEVISTTSGRAQIGMTVMIVDTIEDVREYLEDFAREQVKDSKQPIPVLSATRDIRDLDELFTK